MTVNAFLSPKPKQTKLVKSLGVIEASGDLGCVCGGSSRTLNKTARASTADAPESIEVDLNHKVQAEDLQNFYIYSLGDVSEET